MNIIYFNIIYNKIIIAIHSRIDYLHNVCHDTQYFIMIYLKMIKIFTHFNNNN